METFDHAVEKNDVFGVGRNQCLRPLFEFDDDVRRFAGLRISPTDNDIGPLTGERHPVFDDEFGGLESCVLEIADEYLKASLPRPNLSCGWVIAELVEELLSQLRHKLFGGELGTNSSHRCPIQGHDGSRKTRWTSRSGWSLVLSDASVGPKRITR